MNKWKWSHREMATKFINCETSVNVDVIVNFCIEIIN